MSLHSVTRYMLRPMKYDAGLENAGPSSRAVKTTGPDRKRSPRRRRFSAGPTVLLPFWSVNFQCGSFHCSSLKHPVASYWMMLMRMLMRIVYLRAAAGAGGAAGVLAVHTWRRWSPHDINIDLARRTRRRFDKNMASASGTECLQRHRTSRDLSYAVDWKRRAESAEAEKIQVGKCETENKKVKR